MNDTLNPTATRSPARSSSADGAVRHHPEDDWLIRLSAGQLPTGLMLVTRVHLEHCAACREKAALLGALGGSLLEDLAPLPMRDDALARTLADIDALDRAPPAPRVTRMPAPPPLPQGVAWPRALTGCKATRWRWIGPGVRWSRVGVPGAPDANVFLLRIGAGKYLPPHTHDGVELTQVIHGHFHDGRALFGPGDFDLADGVVHHQPVVQDGSECICVAAVDGRLRFDGWLARAFGGFAGM